MSNPTKALIAARIAKGWTPERARSTPAPGRPMKTEQRPNVSERRRKGPDGNQIVWYEAAVREPDGTRTYLRAYESQTAAEVACAHYLATGEKPPRKPGKRFQHTNPRKTRRGTVAPKQRAAAPRFEQNAAKADRLAMMHRIWRATA